MPPRDRRRGPRPVVRSGYEALHLVIPGDVVAALEKLGIEVVRVTDKGEAVARCPAHEEKLGRADRNPSWSVNISTGKHSCWSCGFRGSFRTLVRYMRRCSPQEADAWIRSQGTIRRVEQILAKEDADEEPEVSEAALAVFSPFPPPERLIERGLTGKVCRQYGVLWDPREEAWILPIRDAEGKLLGWQSKSDTKTRNHPPRVKKSRNLFGLSALPGHVDRLILVESPLDALLISSCGLGWAVASYGASVSDAQMQLILERVNRLIHFPDNDPPGRQAAYETAERWRGRLRYQIVDYRVLGRPDLWDGTDPGDLSPRTLHRLVDFAVPAPLYRP